MAEPAKIPPTTGLSTAFDPAKFPVYDVPQQTIDQYQNAINKQINALEARFAQPNLYNIAAGFFKPQLGGFFASLGSAAEAEGQRLEQERAMAIPIAEMRAKLAQSQAMMGQNIDVSRQIEEWRKKPENAGKQPPADLVAHWASKAPDLPAVKSMLEQQKLSMEARTLSQKEQQQALETLGRQMTIAKELAERGQITPAEYTRRINSYSQQIDALQNAAKFGNMPVPTNTAPSVTTTPSGKPIVETPPPNVQNRTWPDVNQKPVYTTTQPPPTTSAAPAPAQKQSRYLPEFYTKPLLDPQEMRPAIQAQQKSDYEAARTAAYADNEAKQKEFNKLQAFGSALGDYRNIEIAKQTIQDIIRDDPKGAQKLIDAVREGGPLAAAAQAGFGAHVGSIVMNISLPVQAYQNAGLDVNKRTDYDALLSAFATLASTGLHSEGITATNYHPSMFQQSMAKYAGMGQTARNAYHTSMQSALNFREQYELGKLWKQEFQRTNPESWSRYVDAFNSPKITELRDIFQKGKNNLYQQILGKKPAQGGQ